MQGYKCKQCKNPTLMPWKRVAALRGRSARNVLKARRNEIWLAAGILEAATLTTEIWSHKHIKGAQKILALCK